MRMINNDFALLYGILVGDGCISKTGKGYIISITCDINSDQPLIDKLLPIIERIRGKEVKKHLRKDYGKVEINFSDKVLFNKIKDVGFPVGKKGTGLCVSDQLLGQMNIVTGGYFATDGCLVITNNNGIMYPRIEFSSISERLLNQIKDYLLSIGIKGNIYISHKKDDFYKNNLFRLQINGKNNLLNFEKQVGFVNPKHREKFNYFCDNFINN